MPSPVNDGYTRAARAISNEYSGKGLVDVVLVCGGIRTIFLGKVAAKQTTCLETTTAELRENFNDFGADSFYIDEPEGWYVDIESGVVRCPQHRGIV